MGKIINSLWVPKKHSHKGENGKLLVIGGSKKYHGAPVFSLLAARRFVDLLYFYPGEKDPYILRGVKTIPEAMVVYKLDKVKEMDCVLFGIGLGNARFDAKYVIRNAKRLVIDGDGLYLVKGKIPAGAILTPHELEFRRIFGIAGTKENVKKMAEKWKCIILKKDPKGDIISDGKRVLVNKIHHVGMTKGGTGDVLAGLCAALYCKNDAMTAAYAASIIAGKAGIRLSKRFGWNYSASDLANEIATTCQHIL